MSVDGQESDATKTAAGNAAALLGAGVALFVVGTGFDDGAGRLLALGGVALILAGAVLLGKAVVK